MTYRLARFPVLLAVLLAACPMYFPGESLFGPAGPVTYYGMEPMAASPQYTPGQPQIVDQSTVETQLNGLRQGLPGGAGFQWIWRF